MTGGVFQDPESGNAKASAGLACSGPGGPGVAAGRVRVSGDDRQTGETLPGPPDLRDHSRRAGKRASEVGGRT